jgi:hypothetical protein
MAEHTFLVTVTAASREEAVQVMAERLNHDEDYGFDYSVGFEATGRTVNPDHVGEPEHVRRSDITDERDIANAESNRILAERKRQEGS